MTTVKNNEPMQARYRQGRPGLEDEVMKAVKSVEPAALEQTILGIPGDSLGAAKKIAEAALSGSSPLRDRLLNAPPAEVTAKVERFLKMRGFTPFADAANFLAGLREAAVDGDKPAFAKALVDAVFARDISYGEWTQLLGKLSQIKDAGPDLQMVSSREVRRAVQQDLIKLLYAPLIEASKDLVTS